MPRIQRGGRIVVWGLDTSPPVSVENVILWNRYLPSKNWTISSTANFIAINDLVELRAVSYRSRLLNFLLELRSSTLRHQNLQINRIPIWDLLTFSEKSNYAEMGVLNDLIKILALKDFLLKNKIHVSSTHLTNSEISRIIENISHDSKVNKIPDFKGDNSIAVDALLHLKSVIYLFYATLYSISFRHQDLKRYESKKSRIIFQCYKFLKNNQSNYDSIKNHWGELGQVMSKAESHCAWLHLDIFGNKLTDLLRNLIKRPQGIDQVGNGLHIRVRGQLKLASVLKVFADYIQVVIRRRQLTEQLPRLENIDVSRLIVGLIRADCIGPSLMDRIIVSHCFNEVKYLFRTSPALYYLAENYFWEKILIDCFRSQSNGIVGGVLHSTVRFWDLRYHIAKASEIEDRKIEGYYPDKFIVNGPLAKSCLVESGYPTEFLQTIGSLRYSAPDLSIGNNTCKERFDLLVVGDYTQESFANQIRVCNELVRQTDRGIRIGLKVHPGFLVGGYELEPGIELIEVSSFLEALGTSSAILCGQVTSSSLEALYFGKRVLVLLDGDLLNLSPVRGLKGIEWVENADQVRRILCGDDEKPYHLHSYEFEDFLVGNGIDDWCEEIGRRNPSMTGQ